jgi:nucleotide-binding universal stress UspA family protein
MMLDMILVGTDFGPQSREAADWAIELARSLGSRIVIAHAFDLPIYGSRTQPFSLMPRQRAVCSMRHRRLLTRR